MGHIRLVIEKIMQWAPPVVGTFRGAGLPPECQKLSDENGKWKMQNMSE